MKKKAPPKTHISQLEAKIRQMEEEKEMLDEFRFIRTHKSHLVNPKHITHITNNNEQDCLATAPKWKYHDGKKRKCCSS